MKSISTLAPIVLQTIFGTLAIQLARTTRFIRRQGKLRADDFARNFCLFLVRRPRTPLQRLASELGLTCSALSQRLQQRTTARFLRVLLLGALEQLALPKRTRHVLPLLNRFTGVSLVDCTTLGLPLDLVRRFPGCGGGAKKGARTAACKVLLQIDLSTGQSTQLALGSGRTPDVRLLDKLKPLPKGALEVADLGFFDTDRFRAHNRRGVWWLTRLPARISIRPVGAGEWVELARWLEQRGRTGPDHWDGTLQVAKVSPLSMRVLVQRCPPKEAARRRRELRAWAKKKGEVVGWRQLVLCDWWVLATNVGRDRLSPSEATELYRARWQIELVFKRWKSLGHVRVPSDLSANRAECELYGRLLGVLVIDWLALLRGGPVSGTSVWSAWHVLLERLDLIIRAIKGWINWDIVLIELAAQLKVIPKPAPRKKQPSTRQRLLNT
jgi:hypothetical protein